MKDFWKEVRAPLLVAVVAIPLTAWYTKQPVQAICTKAGLKALLFAPVPAWLVILIIAAFTWAIAKMIGQKQRLAELENRPEAPTGPQLHVAWNPITVHWFRGSIGKEPAMQIVGWAHFSQSNATETIILNRAYLEGTEARLSLDIRVPARVAVYKQLMTFVTPVVAQEGKPLTANLIIEDHKN